MPDDLVRYETHGAVATVTLNRPDVLNALTPPLLTALHDAIHRAEDDKCRCLVITGEGRGFCAGQDLNAILADYDGDGSPDLEALLREFYHPVVRGIRRLNMPVVAAINGVAAGAGLSIALACDTRIAIEGARLSTAFTRIGLVPDAGMAWTLPRLVGTAQANRLVMRSEPVSAKDALAIGLVDEVVPGDQFRARVAAVASELAAGPTRAFVLSRKLQDEAATCSLDTLLDLEAGMQLEAGRTADHRSAVAAFLEKRPATFEGR